MDYPWPLEAIARHLDPEHVPAEAEAVRRRLAEWPLHPELVDRLQALYDRFDAATFFQGRWRLHPLGGYLAHGLPDLATWNHPGLWKQHEPHKGSDTFFFCSNSFGDQFGIPIHPDGRIRDDRVGVLWVERFVYQEAKLPWHTFLSRLAREEAVQAFFLRTEEHAWAAQALGTPAPWQCFSSNVPVMLGGSDRIDNVSIQSLAVHVSFTLQVIGQAQQQGLSGQPLGMADVRSPAGDSGA